MRVGVVLAVALQLVTSGCFVTTMALVGSRTTVEIVDAKHEVEVHSVPEGAVIRTASGEVRTAPARVTVPHRIERKGRTYRTKVLFAAVLLSFALGLYFVDIDNISAPSAVLQESFLDGNYKAYAFLADLAAGGLTLEFLKKRNRDWRDRATLRPLPATEELTIEWTGWAPVKAKVVAPTLPFLTVRRPSLGTFDEALIRWDRTSGLEASAKGRLELAGAYDRLAEQTGHAEHARRAVHFYDDYRASREAESDKAEVARVRASALRSKYQIR